MGGKDHNGWAVEDEITFLRYIGTWYKVRPGVTSAKKCLEGYIAAEKPPHWTDAENDRLIAVAKKLLAAAATEG